MKLKGAVIAGIISLGLCIGSYSTSWYRIDATYIVVGTRTYKFFWQDYTTQSGGSLTTTEYTNNNLRNLPTVNTTFESSLSTLTIGAALLLGAIVFIGLRAFFGVGKKSKICRFVGVLLSIAALVLLAVSFFSFLNITQAFLKDQWSDCLNVSLSPTFKNRNCLNLMGSDTGSGFATSTNYVWKPDVGWWLLLAAIIVSFGLAGGSFASNR